MKGETKRSGIWTGLEPLQSTTSLFSVLGPDVLNRALLSRKPLGTGTG